MSKQLSTKPGQDQVRESKGANRVTASNSRSRLSSGADAPLIVAITIGTRGDVIPFCALGSRLKALGYRFRLVAPGGFQELALRCGLEFRKIASDLESVLSSPAISHMIHGGGLRTIFKLSGLRSLRRRIVLQPMLRSWKAAEDANLIIYHPLAFFSRSIAEALDIPSLMLALQPVFPTREIALPIFRSPSLGSVLNRASFELVRSSSILFGRDLNCFRETRLGLARESRWRHPYYCNGSAIPISHAYSPTILPEPSDWPTEVKVSGALPLQSDVDWSPDDSLARFLENGPPPVYIGFGSFPWVSSKIAGEIMEGIKLWGGRALVYLGPAKFEFEDGSGRILKIGFLPFEKLFSRLAGIVHHGGSGTLFTGLSCGLPTFIAPMILDNHLWGSRVATLDVGPTPIPLDRIDAHSFAGKLDRLVSDPSYRAAALEIAKRLSTENGAGNISHRVSSLLSGKDC